MCVVTLLPRFPIPQGILSILSRGWGHLGKHNNVAEVRSWHLLQLCKIKRSFPLVQVFFKKNLIACKILEKHWKKKTTGSQVLFDYNLKNFSKTLWRTGQHAISATLEKTCFSLLTRHGKSLLNCSSIRFFLFRSKQKKPTKGKSSFRSCIITYRRTSGVRDRPSWKWDPKWIFFLREMPTSD